MYSDRRPSTGMSHGHEMCNHLSKFIHDKIVRGVDCVERCDGCARVNSLRGDARKRDKAFIQILVTRINAFLMCYNLRRRVFVNQLLSAEKCKKHSYVILIRFRRHP